MSDDLEMMITNNNLPLLSELEDTIRKHLHLAMNRIGSQVEKAAVHHIQNQDLPWAPLSTAWARYKKRHNYSTQIYIMTSTYIQSITKRYDPANFKVEVGVMRSAMHIDPSTGATRPMWQIAEALEYGWEPKNIPARPLWRPVMEENRRSAQTMVGLAVKKGMDEIAAKATGSPI